MKYTSLLFIVLLTFGLSACGDKAATGDEHGHDEAAEADEHGHSEVAAEADELDADVPSP